MADVEKKAQKLAAARKKLKEFQQKNTKSIKNEENLASSVTTTNSSRHSSISNGIDYTPDTFRESVKEEGSPLHNYFNGTEQHEKVNDINFFDNLSPQMSESTKPLPGAYQHQDVTSLDYPEVASRNVYGFYPPKDEHLLVSTEDAQRLSDFLGGESHDDIKREQSETSPVSFSEHPEQNMASTMNYYDQCNSQPRPTLLSSEAQEHKLRIKHLEDQIEQNKIEYELRLRTELATLQERLDGHVKTIEMYIAENNELSEGLIHNQTLVKQKAGDCEELQGRLKASRTRVADLEKELQVIKAERIKLDQSHNHDVEINQLKQQCEELKQLKEEATQDTFELREKLNIKVNENIGLQRELQDVTGQFSLAQIKIQQLSMGENSIVDALNHQKAELEIKVYDLSLALKSLQDETVQTNLQYQNYVQQLNGQVAQLANRLETLTADNGALSMREQNLVKHIGELEKHLQAIKEERASFGNTKNDSAELGKELDTALKDIDTLRKEKEELHEKYQHICGDQDDLLAELAGKKDIIEQLENELENLKLDQPNNVKLLAAIESDKVAASRAVAQNTTLKQELEEMQQAFVRMSNDKMDLTEQLQAEQFKTHELEDRLSILESKLHTLSDAIEIKDKELTHIRETLSHKNKELLQNNQLTDRLRHYEAQDGSSNALQEDLQKAHDTINQLMCENLKLKEAITLPQHIEDQTTDINNVAPEINEIQTHNDHCSHQDPENNLDKERAMKHLEDKFTRTMDDIANLTEEKQRLEHIVMQLQGETDTIGEYIALYQHQRGILQQRTQEKEEQLKRLKDDRLNVKNKLELVNDLVKKLVLEKGELLPEVLQDHSETCNHTHDATPEHDSCSHDVPFISHEGENNNNSGTASQIIQLLSEIKSSNLVQPCDNLDFHPCACCSGQLFTV